MLHACRCIAVIICPVCISIWPSCCVFVAFTVVFIHFFIYFIFPPVFTSCLTYDIENKIALNNGLDERSGFMTVTSGKIARKRETTQCNTAKFNQSLTAKIGSAHRHTVLEKIHTTCCSMYSCYITTCISRYCVIAEWLLCIGHIHSSILFVVYTFSHSLLNVICLLLRIKSHSVSVRLWRITSFTKCIIFAVYLSRSLMYVVC